MYSPCVAVRGVSLDDESVRGGEHHGKNVYDGDEDGAGLHLHPGPERVQDHHEPVQRDDGQGQRRYVHRHTFKHFF